MTLYVRNKAIMKLFENPTTPEIGTFKVGKNNGLLRNPPNLANLKPDYGQWYDIELDVTGESKITAMVYSYPDRVFDYVAFNELTGKLAFTAQTYNFKTYPDDGLQIKPFGPQRIDLLLVADQTPNGQRQLDLSGKFYASTPWTPSEYKERWLKQNYGTTIHEANRIKENDRAQFKNQAKVNMWDFVNDENSIPYSLGRFYYVEPKRRGYYGTLVRDLNQFIFREQEVKP